MSVVDDYKRQFRWRAWPAVLDALPPLRGALVLDLGCGVGDLSAELAARGARVVGIDGSEDLLRAARSRSLDNVEFRQHDLASLPDLGVAADGIWCSFAAAYFPDLPAALSSWARRLRPGGWIALTEIDDLFGHEPLGPRAKSMLEGYAREALAAKRYDFHMGRKLGPCLERSGFLVSRAMTLPDRELSFDGPADPEVVEAWDARLSRMGLLRAFCGAEFDALREELLACLGRPDHRSVAKVCCCIATKV